MCSSVDDNAIVIDSLEDKESRVQELTFIIFGEYNTFQASVKNVVALTEPF